MISLVVEASTYAGSAALLDGATLVAERSVAMRGKEHEALMSAVGDLMTHARLTPRRIERVICGAGPGSFTSLRIAAAIAKGIAQATGASLVPVPSLALLVGSLPLLADGRYLAVMDAMRGDSYVQEFLVHGTSVIAEGSHRVMATADVDQLGRERGAAIVGPARFGAEQVTPLARAAAVLTNLIDPIAPADLASWEPLYGRLAEAQVKWEADHGHALGVM